jgi:serine/threonine protein kinase
MEPLSADDPRQVSVYRLQARLGAGGMGRVYLAASPGGRAVALKVVHPELARDPEFMQRFRREVESAEAVSGAYTAPVIGAGPDDSPPWMATAYVPGPSLAELVRQSGPLPEAAVWRLAGGLVEALQAIHRRGLVHRDLKPGNILIATDGPRVIDFGISRALHGVAITTARTTMGTPAYMSPEQASGVNIGPASDVFSLGSVLAFATAGSAPFDGGDTLSVIYRIVHAEPDLSRLPPALARLIAWCMAKDPAARPDLGALLSQVTAGSAAFPDSAPGQFWPAPVAAALAGQAAQAGPPDGTTTVPPGGPGGPGGPPPTWPRRSSRRWVVAIAAAGVLAAAAGATAAILASPGSGGQGQASGQSTPIGRAVASTSSSAPPATSPSVTASSSAPASSPPASASPSSSLIAVTVCAFPADGCNLPGAAQYMEVRPTTITDSGDGTGVVKDLVWSNWGSAQATATGTQEVNDCNPNCAQGTYTGYAATVTLAGLTPYGTGLEAYSTIVIQSPGDNGTETYTKDTVPT